MKIFLPPSEKKNKPEQKTPLKLNALSFNADLTTTRTAVLKKHKEIDLSHCDFASNVYEGVLYQALEYASLSAAAQTRANNSIIIISAAFGALRLTDVIPYYKFKIDSFVWKDPLSNALAGFKNELIIDCRSSTYSTVWTPNPLNSVGIRVFKEVAGQLKVITHMSKLTRGEVTRYLVSQAKNPRTSQELHKLLSKEFNCRLIEAEGKKSWFIDVIT